MSDKQVGILKKAHHSLNTSPSKISEVDYEKTIADLEKLVRIKVGGNKILQNLTSSLLIYFIIACLGGGSSLIV